MTQISSKTSNPLLKAITPVKGVVDSDANPTNDDAPSFKDMLMKQFASVAIDQAVDKHVMPTKVEKSEEQEPSAAPVIQLQAADGEQTIDALAGVEIKIEMPTVKAEKIAEEDQDKALQLGPDVNVLNVNPAVAMLLNNAQPEALAPKAELKTDSTKQLAAINVSNSDAAKSMASDISKLDSKVAQNPADSTDMATSQDISKPNNTILTKPVDSHDFAKSLSNSLAKSAEMNEPVSNPALTQASNPVASTQQMPSPLAAAATVNTNQPNLNINTYFGSAGWDKEVNQKVVWMVGGADQSATLTLNPPDLGPVQVVINVNNDKADTTFISDNPEVRQALQDGVDNLREMLKQSGVELGQTNINSNQQHQEKQQNAEQSRSGFASRMAGVTTAENEMPQVSTSRISRALPGQVDIFA